MEAATGRMFTFDIDSKQLRKIKSASLDEVTFEYTSSKMVKVKSVKGIYITSSLTSWGSRPVAYGHQPLGVSYDA